MAFMKEHSTWPFNEVFEVGTDPVTGMLSDPTSDEPSQTGDVDVAESMNWQIVLQKVGFVLVIHEASLLGLI